MCHQTKIISKFRHQIILNLLPLEENRRVLFLDVDILQQQHSIPKENKENI